MTVLVTGATGFVGSAVARKLIGRGEAVRVLARPASDRSNLDGLEVEVAGSARLIAKGVHEPHDGIEDFASPVALADVGKGERSGLQEQAAEHAGKSPRGGQ